MKKILMVAATLSVSALMCNALAATPGEHTAWMKMSEAASGLYTQYMDSSTMDKNGDLVGVWTLLDFNQPQNDGNGSFLSLKMRSEIDCRRHLIRETNEIPYNQHMGHGTAIPSRDFPTEWESISLGSSGATLYKLAC